MTGSVADRRDPRLDGLPDPLEVVPLRQPPRATVALPGSKSITNRALICAALAEGTSTLDGALISDDTVAMLDCLAALGVRTEEAEGRGGTTVGGAPIVVHGIDGRVSVDGVVLDARSSGTTSRFVAPACVASGITVVLDGTDQLRARPMGDLWAALEALGAEVVDLGAPGHVPVEIRAPQGGVGVRTVEVGGETSSQFLSGLLLAAPVLPKGLEVRVSSGLVSTPYVEMTLSVMESFGARVERHDGLRRIVVHPGGYRAREYRVEPDASAASYFFALAAASGGEVTVDGLGASCLQGDLRFVEVLGAMGAAVEVGETSTSVRGTSSLVGVEVDMSDISDTAQTLAAIAPLADGATTVEGVGFVRHKETDRVAAVVAELTRLGVPAEELADGFTVGTGVPRRAVVQTYGDHRMAMSFAVLGMCTPGISIADPGCVAKTFPGFWDVLDDLREKHQGDGSQWGRA